MFLDCAFIAEAGSGIRLENQIGNPWNRAEWLELRSKIDAYFAATPDGQIEQERAAIHERHFGYTHPLNKPKRAPKPKVSKSGFIYLLRGEGTPWYKIGISIKPAERKYTLGTNSPFPILTVAFYGVDDMAEVEAWWHESFAKKRTHGEWFELDECDIDLFVAQEGRPIL